jgi:cytochrome P450
MYAQAQSKPMSLDHDILHRVAPFYHEWSALYGRTFLYWFGSKPRLAIADPDMIKEALMDTGVSFEKTQIDPSTKLFFGQGLAWVTGEKWAFHRRIANQAFKMERVKVMPALFSRDNTSFWSNWIKLITNSFKFGWRKVI